VLKEHSKPLKEQEIMVDKTEVEQTPLSDAKVDAEGALALIAALLNAANQGTAGSLATVLGNASQLASGANASLTSVKDNADINVPESISSYVGLAVNEATAHQGRMRVQAEQITQNAITAGQQITQNAVTQSNAIVTDSIGQKHKRTTDQDIIADFLHFQGLRNEALATDRIWNIDEQIAAAEVLYAALGRFITSSKVEDPTG
jgi:hypothetical protein